MSNSIIFKIILLTIVAMAFCGCGQDKPLDDKNINQFIELRGIKLGMSFEELKSKFPNFVDFPFSDSAEIGQKRIKIKATDSPDLKGLKDVIVFLADDIVYSALFEYEQDFSELSNKELTEQFEEALGLKNKGCDSKPSGSKNELVFGIWTIKKETFGDTFFTACKSFGVTIRTIGFDSMSFGSDEPPILEQRRREIEKKKEMEKPKVFQP